MNDPSPSASPPAPRYRALVVARRGRARSSLLRALRAAGFAVRTSDDPHAGIASFVDRPADVVIVSVEGWTNRDLGFLREIRRRDPSTRILLLVPEGRRRLALRALQSGADGWTPEPYYPEEVVLLASSLVRPRQRAPASADAAVENTAYWVKHHVGNVAQVLSLNANEAECEAISPQVTRLSEMLDILSPVAFHDPNGPELLDLAELTEAAVHRARRALPARTALETGVRIRAPRRQVEQALDALVDCLVGLGRDAAIGRGDDDPDPVEVDLSVDRPEADPGLVQGRVRLRVPKLELEPKRVQTLRDSPFWVGEWTRQPQAGLWLIDRLTREHGGLPTFRPSKRGALVGLAMPAA